MGFRLTIRQSRDVRRTTIYRGLLTVSLLMVLGACSSQGAREAELAIQEAEQVAAEQEDVRAAQELERQRAAEQQRQRQAQIAERARLQAEREREVAARAEEERLQREAVERRERERLAIIQATEAERQQKLTRIGELERQIAAIQTNTTDDSAATEILREAILVAEELLDLLTAEQAKYENTVDGATVEPLAKDLIAELEARKDDLVRRAAFQ